MSLYVVVEGDTDLPVARKLAVDAGLAVALEIDCNGKSQLDANLAGYNASAKGSPWLVLRDLNSDAPCAVDWLRRQRLRASRWMCLRIAVREIESWLLADAHGFARFFGVQESRVPANPDAERDPSRTIVALARLSTKRAVRVGLVPSPGRSVSVGPLYEAMIIEFSEKHWSLTRAAHRSESLRRARAALRLLGKSWLKHIAGPNFK